MAIPFNPPEELIRSYFNRPNVGEQATAGINTALQTYVQGQALKKKQQDEALGTYIKAFEAGGPMFAADIAKRSGLQNPPALPGVTAAMAGPGGTAGVMSNQQPGMNPAMSPMAPPQMAPSPMAPDTPPPSDFSMSPNEMSAGMSMPSEHQPMSMSPIISHWNNTMGAQQGQQAQQPQQAQPASMSQAAPTMPSSAGTPPAPPAGRTNPLGINLPTNPLADAGNLMNQGKYGMGQIDKGLKLQEAASKADETASKAEESGPKTFDYARGIAKASGLPDAAEPFIENAQKEGRSKLNRAELKDLQSSITSNASQKKGDFYEGSLDVKRQAQKLAMTKFAMEQTGGKSLEAAAKTAADRLGQLKRAGGVIDQIAAQGNQASRRQAAEAAISTVKALVGAGVATDGQINEFIPRTARTQFRNWQEFLSGDASTSDLSSFKKEYEQLISRETGINQDIIKAHQDFGQTAVDLLGQSYPSAAQHIRQRGANNSLLSPKPVNLNPGAASPANGGAETKTINGQTFVKQNGQWYHQ